MARACGLNKSRVDQIIVVHTQRHQDDRNVALLERVRRHVPAWSSIA